MLARTLLEELSIKPPYFTNLAGNAYDRALGMAKEAVSRTILTIASQQKREIDDLELNTWDIALLAKEVREAVFYDNVEELPPVMVREIERGLDQVLSKLPPQNGVNGVE